tara:strand:- start:1133 stop:1306 length:174 start_codon:yes stop_codon:yes gene_type:complete
MIKDQIKKRLHKWRTKLLRIKIRGGAINYSLSILELISFVVKKDYSAKNILSIEIAK